MTASFLILHGLQNHRPPGHWQFQLAAKLSSLGHQVLYPSLTDADAPSREAWLAALHAGLDELDGAQNRVVVCHSLACLLWLGSAGTISDSQRVDRLLLVAPPAAAMLPAEVASFAASGADPAAVRASVRGEIRLVRSDNDPWNPEAGHQDYAAEFGLPSTVVPGGGHFTPDDGYGSWPFISDWCLGHR